MLSYMYVVYAHVRYIIIMHTRAFNNYQRSTLDSMSTLEMTRLEMSSLEIVRLKCKLWK